MQDLIKSIRDILDQGAPDAKGIQGLESALRDVVPRLGGSRVCEKLKTPGRYLCYRDPDHGFVVMLMVWGPGDETPVHDHGTWGVEAVLRNSLRITNYTADETNPRPLESFTLEPGDVIHNLPPERDVHKVAHESGDVAMSLHIYGGDMDKNRKFVPGKGFVPCTLKTTQLDEGWLTGFGVPSTESSYQLA